MTNGRGRRAPSGVAAAVLTHMRPRLASATVRSLVEDEGIDPQRITVVVNPPGGLDDPALEQSVRMVRLSTNEGPAGGFRAALVEIGRASCRERVLACV